MGGKLFASAESLPRPPGPCPRGDRTPPAPRASARPGRGKGSPRKSCPSLGRATRGEAGAAGEGKPPSLQPSAARGRQPGLAADKRSFSAQTPVPCARLAVTDTPGGGGQRGEGKPSSAALTPPAQQPPNLAAPPGRSAGSSAALGAPLPAPGRAAAGGQPRGRPAPPLPGSAGGDRPRSRCPALSWGVTAGPCPGVPLRRGLEQAGSNRAGADWAARAAARGLGGP